MTNDNTLLIELHYLPCIQYFVYLASFKNTIIDMGENYTKQTFRNRCQINGANKTEDLIIPVKKTHGQKTSSSLIQIDNNQKWLGKHWRSIQSAYGKAPYFEYYADDFWQIYNKKPTSLFDFNKKLLTKCLELLEIELKLNFSASGADLDEISLYNAKNEINPKNRKFKSALFNSISYFQVFGSNFVDNLSIIDLIFCEGPQARDVIFKSRSRERQI